MYGYGGHIVQMKGKVWIVFYEYLYDNLYKLVNKNKLLDYFNNDNKLPEDILIYMSDNFLNKNHKHLINTCQLYPHYENNKMKNLLNLQRIE